MEAKSSSASATQSGMCYVVADMTSSIILIILWGAGTPDVARKAFSCLHDSLNKLGLSVSQKELVEPKTCVTCLGLSIDTVSGTVEHA